MIRHPSATLRFYIGRGLMHFGRWLGRWINDIGAKMVERAIYDASYRKEGR